MDHIRPNDLLVATKKMIFCENWMKILIEFYQPFIGIKAAGIYATLAFLTEGENNQSHHLILKQTQLDWPDFLEEIPKLQAANLLEVFKLSGDVLTKYHYVLKSPLAPNIFLQEPLLAKVLLSSVGDTYFEGMLKRYKKIGGAVDMRADAIFMPKFKDIFHTLLANDFSKVEVQQSKNHVLQSNQSYFFETFFLMIPASIRNSYEFSADFKIVLQQLASVYNFDSGQMAQVFNMTYQVHGGVFTEQNLRKIAYEMIVSELRQEKKSEVETPKVGDAPYIKDARIRQLLLQVKQLSTIEYIRLLTNNVTPIDLKNVESLQLDYQLPPEVINILLDYVYKTQQTFSKPLMNAIAQEWSKKGVRSAEDAYYAVNGFVKKAKERSLKKTTRPTKAKRTELMPVFEVEKEEKAFTAAFEAALKDMEED